MAKNITIAKLDMDTQSLVDSMQKTAKQIEDLRDKQEKLSQKGKEGTEQFQANEAALKTLTIAQRAQTTALSAQITEDGKLVSVKKAVKDAVNDVNNSENDYIANNKRLLELKKQLNSNDDDYEKRLASINGKMQENNIWLEENGSAHAKLITTMNDYKQQVADSFNEINIFNGGLGGLISRAQEAGGVVPLLKGAFEGMGSGIVGMTKAAWGFVANPIGAIITAIVLAVQLGIAVFKNFTPIVEKVEQVMAAVGAVVETVKNAFIGLFTGDAANFFSNITTGAAEAANSAMQLKAAQQELQKQMELQEVANEKAKNSIDEFTAASEDQTKSEEERLNALAQATKLETDNFNERKKIAEETYRIAAEQLGNGKNLTKQELANLKDKGYAYAQELMARKSITKEELEDLKKAQVEREKIYGEGKELSRRQADDAKKIHEELKAQRDAEVKEQREKNKKIAEDAINHQKQLLDLYIAQNEGKTKTLAEQLKYEEEISAKSKAILDRELKAKKISHTEYETAIENLKKEKAANIASATIEHAKAETDLWLKTHQSKITSETILTQELADEEKKRLLDVKERTISELQIETGLNVEKVQEKRKNNQELTTEELKLLSQLTDINNQYTSNLNDVDKKLKDTEEAAKIKKVQDRQAQYDSDMTAAEGNYQLQKQIEEKRHTDEVASLKDRRDQGLITQQEYDVLMEEETKKTVANTASINKAAMDNKLELANQTFGNLATIMGKESAAGKAMAVAQATIDTYKSAVAAYSAMSGIPIVGPALGAVAAGAAVAAGIANVKKITSTKPPKAEKGALFNIGGNRHSAGGTMFTGADGTQFEAEQGELIGVMNRNAARHFMAFNNAFPASGTSAPNYFSGGGIVSREIAQQTLNTDELAMKIAQANSMLPTPVVSVQDIVTEGNSYVRVRDAANF